MPSARDLLTRLGSRLPASLSTEGERLLRESGSDWSPSYLQGLRLCAALAFSASLLPLAWTGILFLPPAFAVGYHLPLLHLKRMRRRRWARLAEDLPEIADLVAVLCYSGESLHRALTHSLAACGHASTREELEPVLERMRLGESTADALQRLGGHPCPEMRRFGRTLLRAEGSGGPVADILEELSSGLRSARRERNRVHASRVSVYILFPLVFLILPSFLLLTVGGMIIGHTA
ncbi:MAG: type II secretion system F family protein [Actinobacteria bacterium]|nr:type II secretion system F family protein [Actinomycetota bacterium]